MQRKTLLLVSGYLLYNELMSTPQQFQDMPVPLKTVAWFFAAIAIPLTLWFFAIASRIEALEVQAKQTQQQSNEFDVRMSTFNYRMSDKLESIADDIGQIKGELKRLK